MSRNMGNLFKCTVGETRAKDIREQLKTHIKYLQKDIERSYEHLPDKLIEGSIQLYEKWIDEAKEKLNAS